jgi:hypothetical protein
MGAMVQGGIWRSNGDRRNLRHIEDHERFDAPTRQSERKARLSTARPIRERAPHDLLPNAAHLVRRIDDTAPEPRKGSIPKHDRTHKQPVKTELWPIADLFAQHCWDEGDEEHRDSMLAEVEHRGSSAALSAANLRQVLSRGRFWRFSSTDKDEWNEPIDRHGARLHRARCQ